MLDRGGWSTPCPGRFTPGKSWYPLCKRLCDTPPQKFDSWTTQPIVCHYACYAILAWYCLLWWLDDTLQVTRWYMYPGKQWWQYVTDFWSATRPALPGVLAERQDVTWATACLVCDRGWTGVWLLLVPTHVFMEPTVLLVSILHNILSWWQMYHTLTLSLTLLWLWQFFPVAPPHTHTLFSFLSLSIFLDCVYFSGKLSLNSCINLALLFYCGFPVFDIVYTED